MAGLCAQAGAQTEQNWLTASAPAKNRAVKVIDAPVAFLIEFCALNGNASELLISTTGNPNAEGIENVVVLPGECVIVSGETLYVSHATTDPQRRGYFRFRIREIPLRSEE
jgi:hypothetical protein